MLDWQDGLPYSARFGDVYFSTGSGLEETRHVFLRGNDLAQRFAALRPGEGFCIAETGFGTGLNFLCAWQAFERHAPGGASLDFFSVEKYPLDDEELRAALALWPELQAQAEGLRARWRRRVPGWNRWHFAGGRVRLTLALEDVMQALPQLPQASVHAWFLDGFAPSKNPEMWSDAVLAAIARASSRHATLATYTSAGWVRRGLQRAGFAVERVPGFGRKREMVRGRRLAAAGESQGPSLTPSLSRGERVERAGTHADLPLPPGEGMRERQAGEHEIQPPRSALVIGGGLAGCAAAHALARRGIRVTLLESASGIASAASGNPRGILHARFSAGMNTLHRLVLAAYGHALALLDEVLPVDGVHRAECGLLQLAATEDEVKRIGKLAAQAWPPHLLQAVDVAQASRLAGMPMAQGGLWFPAGGWVVPPEVCAALLRHADVELRLNSEVTGLQPMYPGWCASGAGFACAADVVVVCSAHRAKRLAQFAPFPLQPVRGQISVLPATEASRTLKAVLCAEGYCAPAVAGQHVCGASSSFDDEATDIRTADHAGNLAKLAAHMPALYRALVSDSAGASLSFDSAPFGSAQGKPFGSAPFDSAQGKPFDSAQGAGRGGIAGRAAVRCSVPGATPLAGEVEPGLYCSLAHGTRGLLTAGIAAEVIAAQVCGTLPPLPQELLAALSPSRYLGR